MRTTWTGVDAASRAHPDRFARTRALGADPLLRDYGFGGSLDSRGSPPAVQLPLCDAEVSTEVREESQRCKRGPTEG